MFRAQGDTVGRSTSKGGRSRRRFGVAAAAGALAIIAAAASGQTNPSAPSFTPIARVLQSPRCVNCHPQGNRPLQGDDHHLHLMRVTRGPDNQGAVGARCNACHRDSNSAWSIVPGAPHWGLAPASMSWQGLSEHQLCIVLRDPGHNGNRSLSQLVEHLDKDALVLWGWQPGDDRAPVAMPHDEFIALFKAWAAAGGPCP